jgi:hypothetical protein
MRVQAIKLVFFSSSERGADQNLILQIEKVQNSNFAGRS